MRPWEVAILTDHQIVHCYLLPQARRNEAMKNRNGGGEQPAPEEDTESVPIPPRKLMVANYMQWGMSRESAEAEYDNQLRMNAVMQRKAREQDSE